MNRTMLVALLTPIALFSLACDDGPTGTGDTSAVTVAFSTAGTAATVSATGGVVALASSPTAAADVALDGTNGTLTITDIAFIVDEFKLERVEASCEEVEDGDDDDACEKFETGVAFVELHLNGGVVPVVTEPVPAGTYVAMKFEVKDGRDDSGDEIAALLDAIAAAGFADWPADASLVIAGTFTPVDGESRSFTAYFDAEVKIEMDFDPALVIGADDGTIDIEVDPMAWFTNVDDTVTDLSAFDYAATGEVADFEVKLENGFTKIELEGFDD